MSDRTLCDLFYRSVETFRKPDHLQAKREGAFRPLSSEEFRRAVEEVSMGVRALGLEKGQRAAILSENRPEWAFADLAVLCAACVDVPIYPSLPAAQVAYILKDSESAMVFVSNAVQAKKVAEIRDKVPSLRHVVAFEGGVEGTLSLEDLRAKGRTALVADREAVKARAAEAKADDLATLIYTSGTTGDPKGVMLTHRNIVSNVESSLAALDLLGPSDVALSFLPLCHIFERMAGYYLMLEKGCSIAYAESVEQVPNNMVEVRPTVMASVPRLYEKMYARIREKVASDSPTKQKIFRWAVSVGRQVFQHTVNHTTPGPVLKAKHALADKLVFSKLRERTGGRLRFFVSGGAPLAREIAEFFGSVGLSIYEGYGLTETSPVITVNTPSAIRLGSVGRPIKDVEVRIAEDGEILTRGPHVMKGYYNKPEASAEALDPEGWFHTGDVGIVDDDGFLIITDRKKDIIVTSGGKNIAPQPIENQLKTHRLIGEIVMIGNKRNFASALVVPNFANLEPWAKEQGISWTTREELIASPRVRELYERTVQELTKDLAQFERIKKVALLPAEFTLEAGELTPTLKVKRRVVEQKYKDLIDRLYEDAAA